MLTILLIVVAAGAFAILASVVMTWASHRSALWSMALGGVLAVVVLIAALLIAFLLARSVLPS